jgi:hypothetical protein
MVPAVLRVHSVYVQSQSQLGGSFLTNFCGLDDGGSSGGERGARLGLIGIMGVAIVQTEGGGDGC